MIIKILTLSLSLPLVFGAALLAAQAEQGGQITLSSCLENMIQSKFESDPRLKDADIRASVEENKVTLSGTVHSNDLRSDAVRIVEQTAPGYTIADTIDVRPEQMARAEADPNQTRKDAEQRGDTIGQSEQDAQLYSQFFSRLSTSGVQKDGIKIDVTDGVITLQGNVKDENTKRKVQEIAQQTPGVKETKNELAVQGSQPAQ
ncbi:MAG: BON domain-containing protein [Acidobacteria bacterium]|nr:BON domain-containing protein [Acidobacteriota bacterium]